MAHITDCPLCELRFHREHELIDHLRTDHRGQRAEAFAELIARTARQRRTEQRRRARGGGTRARTPRADPPAEPGDAPSS